jgi:hypothetical protein
VENYWTSIFILIFLTQFCRGVGSNFVGKFLKKYLHKILGHSILIHPATIELNFKVPSIAPDFYFSNKSKIGTIDLVNEIYVLQIVFSCARVEIWKIIILYHAVSLEKTYWNFKNDRWKSRDQTNFFYQSLVLTISISGLVFYTQKNCTWATPVNGCKLLFPWITQVHLLVTLQ